MQWVKKITKGKEEMHSFDATQFLKDTPTERLCAIGEINCENLYITANRFHISNDAHHIIRVDFIRYIYSALCTRWWNAFMNSMPQTIKSTNGKKFRFHADVLRYFLFCYNRFNKPIFFVSHFYRMTHISEIAYDVQTKGDYWIWFVLFFTFYWM